MCKHYYGLLHFHIHYNAEFDICELFQELELRIDTQKQTLLARDESIKKLLEMLQTKGLGKSNQHSSIL